MITPSEYIDIAYGYGTPGISDANQRWLISGWHGEEGHPALKV